MDSLDIFNIEPTKISRDLSGKFILIYGEAKSGKTSTSVLWEKPLLVAFEKGYNTLPGIKAVDITKWADFKRICSSLKKPEAKEMYKTIIIDTTQIAYDLCEKYIVSREGVDSISDIEFGKGWNMLKSEFADSFRELSFLGYSLVFIAHSKTRKTSARDEKGEQIQQTIPDLTTAAFNIVSRLVDIIAFIKVEIDPLGKEDDKRFMLLRSTPEYYAGNRYKHLVKKIPLGYKQLANAIADAIEKQVEVDGAGVTDNTVLDSGLETVRDFNEVMGELKSIWNTLATRDEENKKRMNEIVEKIFGKPIVLKDVTEKQQEMVELVLDELKELL